MPGILRSLGRMVGVYVFSIPYRKGDLKTVTAFGISGCVCEDLSVSDGQTGLK